MLKAIATVWIVLITQITFGQTDLWDIYTPQFFVKHKVKAIHFYQCSSDSNDGCKDLTVLFDPQGRRTLFNELGGCPTEYGMAYELYYHYLDNDYLPDSSVMFSHSESEPRILDDFTTLVSTTDSIVRIQNAGRWSEKKRVIVLNPIGNPVQIRDSLYHDSLVTFRNITYYPGGMVKQSRYEGKTKVKITVTLDANDHLQEVKYWQPGYSAVTTYTCNKAGLPVKRTSESRNADEFDEPERASYTFIEYGFYE